MRRAALLTLAFAMLAVRAAAAEIPARPEQLTYPPLTFTPPDPAAHRVALKSGPVAYLVPDRERPLIQITVLLRAGQYLDPADRPGLAALTGYLLAAGGTEKRPAIELEEQLEFLAAKLQSGIEETQGLVSLNLLSKDLDAGVNLLREVLATPRFQEDRLTLAREQTLQQLRQRNDESESIERRERRWLAYGTNFWIGRLPTGESIARITRDDLRAFHRRWIHPANFVVAVSGDFDREAMIAQLERLFAAWPQPGDPVPPVPADPAMAAPGVYLYPKAVNQARVCALLPGILRDRPDHPAIEAMNEIFGGGGFTSRLTNRIRTEAGLAYSVGSSARGGIYFPNPILAAFQTKSRTALYAISLLQDEIRRITTAPVSDRELETARRSLVDTFPENFASADKTAALFASDELTGRFAKQPDYWKTYRARVEAVTADDVLRVARELLQPAALRVLIVGEKDDVLRGDTDHPVQVSDLKLGEPHPLPERDPLTLEPTR